MQPKNIIYSALFLVLTTVMAGAADAGGSTARDWAKATSPTLVQGLSQSIGSYSNGCLAGAAALPLNGPGYQLMRLSRHHYFGHPDLIEFIGRLGQTVQAAQLGTLLIGDLGQARGGPMLSGHRSHQTGLDVDIWFLLVGPADDRPLIANERETWSAPSVIDTVNSAVDYRQWSNNQALVLAAAALSPQVDRIFVNPIIKQALCNTKTPATGEWLRKIRPWWKHDDHFHVRLKCPAQNPHCEQQEPLPVGDGCDASLAWWFTAEANAPAKTLPLDSPPLPALCEQLLRQR